jgi:cytochrome c-type biogenesis protein CcmH
VSLRSGGPPTRCPGVGGPGPTTSVPYSPSRTSPKTNHSAPRALVLVVLAAALHAVCASPALAAGPGAPRTTLPTVEGQVMCVTCKIPLLVAQSPQASRERAFIQHLILLGRTETQIKRALVAQYGPAVLALPPAHGFDLAAYLVPPCVVLALLVLLALLLPRWRRRARAAAAGDAVPSPTLSPADATRLEADMARFD